MSTTKNRHRLIIPEKSWNIGKKTKLRPLPTRNDEILANRYNKYFGAKLKKDVIDWILIQYNNQELPNPPKPWQKISYQVVIFARDKRIDPDNWFASAMKFFQDAMQKVGLIQNDGWDNVIIEKPQFFVDKKNPRIEFWFKKEVG
jgi:hypothetical protein